MGAAENLEHCPVSLGGCPRERALPSSPLSALSVTPALGGRGREALSGSVTCLWGDDAAARCVQSPNGQIARSLARSQSRTREGTRAFPKLVCRCQLLVHV